MIALKKITMRLNSRDISKAIKELKKYRTSLNDKNELFIKRLAEIGIPVIEQRINEARGDSSKEHLTHIEVNRFGNYAQAKLIVQGNDIMFIEFGAGIHYNTSPGDSLHPKGSELGYTIGSYGKGQGKRDSWFYYADSGEAVMSHGTEATMPVYSASVEIRNNMIRIAKEVFGG